ncbi:MAG: hypothetical protein IID63_06115 [candidate division Zixibacteria bacterium]|nr:hypothetical protein [candidate division Zixibacteria bacterium]
MKYLTTVVIGIAAILLLVAGCDREITGDVLLADNSASCTECHDPSNLITGKKVQWEESEHGMGTAYLRGTSRSCAGCHSGNGFAERVAAGLDPNELAAGDPDPTRQDCRACHMIHETYTLDDFALRTTSPVTFYADPGVTFNGGEGNLCVNCHQPRRVIPAPVNDTIYGISSHWGPHHGPQSSMLLGVGGAGVTGTPHGHYGAVDNTCVDCHMGDGRNHTFEPDTDNCVSCHPDIGNNFDYRGVQTEIIALADSLGAGLLALGLINENSEDGHPIVSQAHQDEAIALWNWIYVAHEDRSNGVHNYGYAKALLEEGLTKLGLARSADPNGAPSGKIAVISSH